jgi:hypothetical protein
MESELGIEEPVTTHTHDDFVITAIVLASGPKAVRWQRRVDRG